MRLSHRHEGDLLAVVFVLTFEGDGWLCSEYDISTFEYTPLYSQSDVKRIDQILSRRLLSLSTLIRGYAHRNRLSALTRRIT